VISDRDTWEAAPAPGEAVQGRCHARRALIPDIDIRRAAQLMFRRLALATGIDVPPALTHPKGFTLTIRARATFEESGP